jgi:hypothetical protein
MERAATTVAATVDAAAAAAAHEACLLLRLQGRRLQRRQRLQKLVLLHSLAGLP